MKSRIATENILRLRVTKFIISSAMFLAQAFSIIVVLRLYSAHLLTRSTVMKLCFYCQLIRLRYRLKRMIFIFSDYSIGIFFVYSYVYKKNCVTLGDAKKLFLKKVYFFMNFLRNFSNQYRVARSLTTSFI